MADRFFQEVVEKRMIWVERKSAFCSYRNRPIIEETNLDLRLRTLGGGVNMNKRMIELWKRNWAAASVTKEPERQRCYRHMISERMRREKQKKNYSALHTLLPHGTKGDKNSVIQAAAMEIQRLQSYGEELRRRSSELESKLATHEEGKEEEGRKAVKIRVKMANNPTSGIDSMLQILKCLKNLGVKIKAFHSGCSGLESFVALEVESVMSEATVEELERSVHGSLHEAERKLLPNFHGG